MPYTVAKFDAQFIGPLVANVLAVLRRDNKTAVEEVDATLKEVQSFQIPLQVVTNFPALFVVPASSTLRQSDDDSYIKAVHEILIGFAITAPDAETVTANVAKYMQAFDSVLRTMSRSDLTSGMTSVKTPPVWEVTAHEYGGLRQADNWFRRDAQLVLTIEISELITGGIG
jgi:hypothetical protein